MKIKVRDITSSGLMFQTSIMPRDIGLEEEFVNEEIPLSVDGLFRRVGDVVLADIEVVCGIEEHCARCLERISRKVSLRYEQLDFDLGVNQEFIDVGERVREEIVLDHGPRMLCKDDCRGLCTGCGVDLNYQKCECKDKDKKE